MIYCGGQRFKLIHFQFLITNPTKSNKSSFEKIVPQHSKVVPINAWLIRQMLDEFCRILDSFALEWGSPPFWDGWLRTFPDADRVAFFVVSGGIGVVIGEPK